MADPGGIQFDPQFYASLPAVAAQKQARSPFTAGVAAGLRDLQSYGGSVVQGAGQYLGLPSVEQTGAGIVNDAQAAQASPLERPDLNTPPWRQGGAAVIPWLEYQASRQVPLLASYLLAGRLTPQSLVPQELERIGAAAPRVLGGGGLKAGADFATRRAAIEAGKDFGKSVVGAEVAGLPVAFASMYQEAQNKPGGASSDDVVKAAALSPVYAALDALEPAQFKGLLQRGLAGNALKRIATAGFVSAAAEVPQEGLQTAMEQSFRSDLSPADKMRNIVDAAVTGGAVGSIFGGVGGIRAMKHVNPSELTTDNLNDVVSNALQLPAPNGGQAFGQGQTMQVTPEGVVQPGSNYQQSELDVPQRPAPEVRPMAGATDEELLMKSRAAQNYLNNLGDKQPGEREALITNYLRLANAELQNRGIEVPTVNNAVSNDNIPLATAGAVERGSDVSGGSAAKSFAAPASASQTWETQRDGLLKGVSTRKAYLGATSLDDMKTILTTRLEKGSAAKGDLLIADRLGVDLNEPAKVATAQEGTQGQAGTKATVDEAFQSQLIKDMANKRGLALQDLRANPPANLADAQERIFDLLGKNLPGEDEARNYGHQDLINLAQKYGVLDDNEKYTPAALDIARKGITIDETVQEAHNRGYSGAEASVFDKGARGQPATLDSIEQLKLYNEGRDWAHNSALPENLKSAAETAQFVADNTAGPNKGTTVRSATIPEKQRNMQFLNQAIDQIYGTMTTPQEQAQLKRMAREGASPQDLDEAARYFASGRGALIQEQPAAQPFKGVTIDRGPVIRARERAQAAAQAAAVEQGTARQQKAAASTAVAEHNRYKAQLRDAIKEGIQDGSITGKQRISLIHMLVNNNLKGVEEGLSNPTRDQQRSVSRRQFMAGLAASAATTVGATPIKAASLVRTPVSTNLRTLIESGDVNGTLEHIQNHSTNPSYRMIARKLLRGGMGSTRIQVGEADPYQEGDTHLEDDGSSTVTVNENGLNEETALHEMIHAYVQQRWAGLKVYTEDNKALLNDKTDRADAVIRNWQKLWNKIGDAIAETNPELMQKDVLTGGDLAKEELARNPDEMLSWVLTNPQAQAYLRTIDENGNKVGASKSIWTQIVDFFRRLLGLPESGQATAALNQLLSAGYSVLDAGANVKTGDFNTRFAAELQHERSADQRRASVDNINASASDNTKSAVNTAENLIRSDSAKGVLRSFTLPWHSENHIKEFWGKRWFDINGSNGIVDRYNAMDYMQAIKQRFAMLRTNAMDTYDRLYRNDRKSAENIVELMKASQLGIDPRVAWDNQSEAVKNRPGLKASVTKYNNMYRGLTAKGHAAVYDNLHYVNDAIMLAHMALSLHLDTETDAYMKGKLGTLAANPIDDFMHAQVAKDFNVTEARKWFSDRLTAQVNALKTQLATMKQSQLNTSIRKATRDSLQAPIDEFSERINQITNTMAQLDQAPYFHLGRFGDFFVSFKTEDATKLRRAADQLRRAGFKYVINDLSNATDQEGNLRVYMRVENRQAWKNLSDAVAQLEKVGLAHTVLRGQRDVDSFPSELTPHRFEKLIANINASDLPQDVKNDTITRIRGLSVDMLPETAIGRMLAEREDVPGFDPDMIRAFDFRMMSGINALAGMTIEPTLTKAFVDMRAATYAAQHADPSSVSLNQRSGMVDIVKELAQRDRERAWWPRNKLLDQIRAFSSSHFLGFSPSFGLLNLSQMGVTLLPQLGAKYGYSRTLSAMASATALAFKVMRQVASQGSKISMSRAMDAVITRDVLDATPGLSPKMADYIMHVVNRGGVDIGGQSREMLRSAEGRGSDFADTYMRWASSVGYYTETMSRLVAAIATHKLSSNTGEKLVDEAMLHITDAMWNYAMSNQGRRFGKRGVLGEYSPLALQFMQYQAQLTEKLIRETYNAFGGTDAEKAIGRKYLKGHLAAMTVLAGTMGLPMVTVLAGLFDRLKDLWDDDNEPSDVRAAYRNWLAGVIGKDPAELVSHGVFRGAGLDISQRAGEQDIVPFSKFLADRRQFKDKAKDLALQTWGAPSSMIANWFKGGEMIADGEVLNGAATMLPNYIAGPVKAGKLVKDGYVDAEGKKIPVSDNARSVMVQLLGFNPSEKAEYNEARNDVVVRQGLLARDATVIRDQLARAIVSGDEDKARELIGQAQQFDEANPSFAVLPNIGDVIRRRARVEAIAKATRAPLGVDPRDLQGQQLTAFANY